jgi:hypothetical protein
MVQALIKADKCVLNRGNGYLDLHKDVVRASFNIDESLKGFEDCQQDDLD